MYWVANWFNMADEACEDAMYDIPVFRDFCGFDLGRERISDATSLLKFRHLLEENDFGKAMFARFGTLLQANGVKVSGSTIVDATLIAAPPSTKNEKKARHPEMHQVQKGNQWHFSMKVHLGTDSQTGLIHSASVTQPMYMTAMRCRTCCMAKRGGSTVTVLTGARLSVNASRN